MERFQEKNSLHSPKFHHMHPNALVWVKSKGFPVWPSRVVNTSEIEDTFIPEKIEGKTTLVKFFGCWAGESDMSEFWGNLSRFKAKNSRKAFREAIEEAKAWRDRIQEDEGERELETSGIIFTQKDKSKRSIETEPGENPQQQSENTNHDLILSPNKKSKTYELLHDEDNNTNEKIDETVDMFAPTQPMTQEDDFVDPYAPTQPLSLSQEPVFTTPLSSPIKPNKKMGLATKEIIEKLGDIEENILTRIDSTYLKLNNSINERLESLENKLLKNHIELQKSAIIEISKIGKNLSINRAHDTDLSLSVLGNIALDFETLFGNICHSINLVRDKLKQDL